MLTLVTFDQNSTHSKFSSGMNDEISLMKQLEEFRFQHRQLDDLLDNHAAKLDQLELQRAKKKRLTLRDEIRRLEAILYPDIIA